MRNSWPSVIWKAGDIQIAIFVLILLLSISYRYMTCIKIPSVLVYYYCNSCLCLRTIFICGYRITTLKGLERCFWSMCHRCSWRHGRSYTRLSTKIREKKYLSFPSFPLVFSLSVMVVLLSIYLQPDNTSRG